MQNDNRFLCVWEVITSHQLWKSWICGYNSCLRLGRASKYDVGQEPVSRVEISRSSDVLQYLFHVILQQALLPLPEAPRIQALG
jgi:hypothetical protein